jgi:hypothetical protein
VNDRRVLNILGLALSDQLEVTCAPQRGTYVAMRRALSFGARIKFASRVQGTPCGIVVSAFCGGEGDALSSAVQPVMTAT